MKRTIISIIIATLTLSLAGCSNRSKDTYDKITKLEMKIDELSAKIDESQKLNLEMYRKEYSTAEIRVDYVPDKETFQEKLKFHKEKYEAEGKTVFADNIYGGNRLFIIQAPERIKNLTSFSTHEWDTTNEQLIQFINEAHDKNLGNIKKNLNPGEVLIFSMHETEGVPMGGFFWTEPDGTTLYNFASIDGSGEKYIYD